MDGPKATEFLYEITEQTIHALSHQEVESLLRELREERSNLFGTEKPRMQELVDILVQAGVYPTDTPAQKKFGYTPKQMVICWGVEWHRWKDPLNCPHCDSDLRDHTNGPPFKLEMGKSDSDLDMISEWKCPSCHQTWPR